MVPLSKEVPLHIKAQVYPGGAAWIRLNASNLAKLIHDQGRPDPPFPPTSLAI